MTVIFNCRWASGSATSCELQLGMSFMRMSFMRGLFISTHPADDKMRARSLEWRPSTLEFLLLRVPKVRSDAKLQDTFCRKKPRIGSCACPRHLIRHLICLSWDLGILRGKLFRLYDERAEIPMWCPQLPQQEVTMRTHYCKLLFGNP